MHERSLGSKADPAFSEVHGAHRQQQTVQVVAIGTFLIRRDSTRHSYAITELLECCIHGNAIVAAATCAATAS
jgi:hypothetical protein